MQIPNMNRYFLSILNRITFQSHETKHFSSLEAWCLGVGFWCSNIS